MRVDALPQKIDWHKNAVFCNCKHVLILKALDIAVNYLLIPMTNVNMAPRVRLLGVVEC